MFDKKAISQRFFSCYQGKSRRDMALLFDVSKDAVRDWIKKWNVPWRKLKYLSDSQAVSGDWLLSGVGSKDSGKEIRIPSSTSPRFNHRKMTSRFLSLFPDMTQTEIATLLDVTTSTVNDWTRHKNKVGWERLAYAVEAFGVRWDWIIDGVEPKYRED